MRQQEHHQILFPVSHSSRQSIFMSFLICPSLNHTVSHTLLSHTPGHVARGILVPQPGIEPKPLAVKERSPNHWTARGFPHMLFF